MKKATVTRIMNNEFLNDVEAVESLGFRRVHVLPIKFRHNMSLNLMLKGVDIKKITQKLVSFFESMTCDEFKTYLLTH